LKLLLDQGLPRSAARELVRLGFDAVHAGDIGMATAADHELVEYARREAQTVITLDADFHALLALSNAVLPSVVRVRIQGLRGEELAALVERVVALCDADLRAGAMVTVDEHSVRVRALPLVR
jgi:predicted nuclease of predicted toxin-antitoxin system